MPSTPNEKVVRSRFLREIVLKMLWTADGAMGGSGFSYEQIRKGFASSRLDVSASEVRRELNDLVGDELLGCSWDEDLAGNYYAMTSRGRDFVRAEMPWEKIDDFTG